ncbi:hypothetical protein KR222_005595 [Zaprionus bogoriensis]|nr:hypothetical protein KR222_005595 [Zaprionus bogoriensis]
MCRPILRVLLALACLIVAVAVPATSNWQLPTQEQAQLSLQSCRSAAAGEDAGTLRCLVEQLGLWTDARGYHAKRIAKLFASHNQLEELQLVVEYCNGRERRAEQPALWAYEAYRCATAGRLGKWVQDYMNGKKNIK